MTLGKLTTYISCYKNICVTYIKAKLELLIDRGCQHYIHCNGKITNYSTSNKTSAYL